MIGRGTGLAVGRALLLLLAASQATACRARPRPAGEDAGTAARDAAVAPARDGRVPVVIPAQCYTRTVDAEGRVHNPCFTCHTQGREPNYVADADLQTSYAFAPAETQNPWTNLFVDRRASVDRISSDEALAWARQSNYPPELPASWDGVAPDAAFSFDELGFDRRPDGTATGWRAYAYTPLPGSFFATNGSMDDALVRLPDAYRQRVDGTADTATYIANLAIARSVVTARDVAIDPTAEAEVGADLDGDGRLATAAVVVFRKAPGAMGWAGRAGVLQREGRAPLAPGLFPLGTEFLHSVRYLDVRGEKVTMAARMKELRYAKKTSWLTYADHLGRAREEELEKKRNGARARVIEGGNLGVDNGRGWRYAGFIENERGALRPQTYRETASCVGCHGGIGVNVDSAISFQRQLPATAFRRGWSHPSQRDHTGLPEPKLADGRWEYSHYLAQNGAGDEMRANDEVARKFFDERGELRPGEIARVHDDVSYLLLPSPARALLLNKATMTIVREQSFERGGMPTTMPAQNVHREVRAGTTTGIAAPLVVR